MYYHFRKSESGNNSLLVCEEFPHHPDIVFEGHFEKIIAKLHVEFDKFMNKQLLSEKAIPLPGEDFENTEDLVYIRVQPEIAYSILLRHYRMKNEYTKAQMAAKLSCSDGFAYLGYEKGRGVTVDVIDRTAKFFADFPVEEIFS